MTTPDQTIDQNVEQALQLQRNGDLDGAETLYRAVLTQAPDHAEARHFLGVVLHQRGRHSEAAAHISKAVDLLPSAWQFKFNLGLVLTATGDFSAAAEAFQAVIDAGIDDPQVRNAHAVALKGAGHTSSAETAFKSLIAAHPDFAGAYFNLGNLYLTGGRASAAVPMFEAALDRAPGDGDTTRNLAAALQAIGETAGARRLLEERIAAEPDDAAALNNLGNLCRQSGERDRARDLLTRALSADPDLADAAYNLGAVLADLNDMKGAGEAFQRAVRLRPGFTVADWSSALSLPQIYASVDERADARARWLRGLEKIASVPLPTEAPGIDAAFRAVAEITPFALAYQGEDDKQAMTTWGAHVAAIARAKLPDLAAPPITPKRERRRVGFVSAHFRAHTVTRLFGSWLTGLDPKRFEVHLISTSGPGDATTAVLSASLAGIHTQPMDLTELARHIHGLACDVLIYPDIGMDPRTQVLAALPLAPRQAMAWGHPVTSGFPDIDVFLTAELMEPADGDTHYRERLVRLPGLSIDFERPHAMTGDLPHHDFLCAQSLFKVPPEQDRVFADILRSCPGATLSFFSHPIAEVTAAFRARLESVFQSVGLDPETTLVFIPPAPRDTFLRHLAGARVVLDTFHWSGGNTSLETFAQGTPIVTLPGRFMRGRHTAAMLEKMALPELIAVNTDDFIAKSVELFEGDSMGDAVAERAPILFGDRQPIDALNQFLNGF